MRRRTGLDDGTCSTDAFVSDFMRFGSLVVAFDSIASCAEDAGSGFGTLEARSSALGEVFFGVSPPLLGDDDSFGDSDLLACPFFGWRYSLFRRHLNKLSTKLLVSKQDRLCTR